eukprot:1147829-Pelagomonas_calceolata.AAC.2
MRTAFTGVGRLHVRSATMATSCRSSYPLPDDILASSVCWTGRQSLALPTHPQVHTFPAEKSSSFHDAQMEQRHRAIYINADGALVRGAPLLQV